MSYKKTIHRIKQLISSPSTEWQIISNEKFNPVSMIGKYWIHLLVLYFIGALLGIVLFSNDIERSFLNKLLFIFGKLFLIITAFIFSFSGILRIAKHFEIEVTKKKVFTVLFYSYTIVWLIAAFTALLANYKTLIRFIHIASIYGFILFQMGSDIIIVPLPEKRYRFYAWTFGLLIIIYLGMYFMSIHLIRFFAMLSGLFQSI